MFVPINGAAPVRKSEQRFGGVHTERKLAKLEAYLKSYSTALKHQNFRLIFFDAFAGTGDIQTADEAPLLEGVDEYTSFIEGSAQRALRFGEAFDEYVFVEKSRWKVRELNSLRSQFPVIADRISVRHGDANSELRKFCEHTDWKRTRAVVFLDPCGNQVGWGTIVALAKTDAIDLWYLFPAGLGVHRQISKVKGVHKTHEASLDWLLGTTEWRNRFVGKKVVADLFEPQENQERRATAESITQFMAERMKTVFRGGVLDAWLPLGARNIHMYSLMFAWANPSENAKLAGKLALAVLRSGGRGRA
jgi:three-Cys-motif partner protein